MKRFIVLVGLLMFGMMASAEIVEIESNINMDNFWEKNGKEEQKVLTVGTKIINANKLSKRIPLRVGRNMKVINASSAMTHKTVVIYTGILPYFDNDDELAFVVSHEIAHSLDCYDGLGKWLAMILNSKQYEYKADLIGVDLMVKAGYNPIAAITTMNKAFPETYFDFGILSSHPRTSKRIFEVYKYIYKKYPTFLNSDMVHNVNYVNFTYSAEKDIKMFQQIEKERPSRKKVESL